MASTVMARRQVWLAQTSLPEGVRRDLIGMLVMPSTVFHPDSQGLAESAERVEESWSITRPAGWVVCMVPGSLTPNQSGLILGGLTVPVG